MNALSKLIAVEAKLFLREPVSLFFVFALPLGLMLVFGLPQRGASGGDAGQHGELTFLPALALALTIGMLALFTLPMALGIYRERRVLRRLATTPVNPALLLVAQVVVNLVMGVAGAVVTAVGVRFLLDQPAPANVPAFVLAFLLGVACLFAVGLLIAALAPSARAAQSIGPALFFPLLFLAGACCRATRCRRCWPASATTRRSGPPWTRSRRPGPATARRGRSCSPWRSPPSSAVSWPPASSAGSERKGPLLTPPVETGSLLTSGLRGTRPARGSLRVFGECDLDYVRGGRGSSPTVGRAFLPPPVPPAAERGVAPRSVIRSAQRPARPRRSDERRRSCDDSFRIRPHCPDGEPHRQR